MNGRRVVSALLVGLAGLAVVFGCEDNPEPPQDLGQSSISIVEIILTPKSPVPGDTISLTAIIEGDEMNIGDFPVVKWTASDGLYLEDDQISVRWESPPASGLFGITCRATNSVNTTTASTQVFVGTPIVLVEKDAGEIHTTGTGNDFYYQSTMDIADGTSVSGYIGGVVSEVAPGLGENRVFSPDVTKSAHSVFNIISGRLIQEQHIVVVDFATGVEKTITSDNRPFFDTRHLQHDFPYFSPGSDLVTYQVFSPSPPTMGLDTLDVVVQTLATDLIQVPTLTHGERRRNMFPTFSSDGNWLVFVSNRTGTNVWELYGLRITGGVVDTVTASTVRLTNTSGRIAGRFQQEIQRPEMQWNPSGSSPVLAVLDADEILYLVATNGGGATQTTVTGIEGRVRQFVWSSDGQTLAVTNFSKIFKVDLQGNSVETHAGIAGDQVRDMTWSPDGLWLAYRVVRGGGGWFELLDVDAGKLASPAVLTAVTSSNNVTAYGLKMNMSPGYAATNELYLLEFISGAILTPRVTLLDVSGVVQ